MKSFSIDPDITHAQTLPGWFYSDENIFKIQREKIFSKSWQFVGDTDVVKNPGAVYPTTLLEGCLNEPLVLARDTQNKLYCFSNVCTHRGNSVCEKAGTESQLRCRYHGRRFGLDGKMLSMPEFEGVNNFPSEKDNLPHVAFGTLGKLVFASLSPFCSFEDVMEGILKRCGDLPFDRATFDSSRSRDYEFEANWALYCDNYLEGFHIPYVHPGLNEVIDYSSYKTELFTWSNLQVGVAKAGEEVFKGTTIGAYYWWVFPNTMINLYPWGISLNVVKPQSVSRTKVSFLTYVWDEKKLDRGAGSGLDQVELEDEAVVTNVQKGVRSRLYDRGKYSPLREQGVHHFHRLLSEMIPTE